MNLVLLQLPKHGQQSIMHLDTLFTSISKRKIECVLVGDFNIDHLKSDVHCAIDKQSSMLFANTFDCQTNMLWNAQLHIN